MLHPIFSRLIRQGTLTVCYPDGTTRRYGNAGAGPSAAMEVRTPRALRRMVLNPGLAFGECYVDGEIAPVGCGIYDLLDVLVLNMAAADADGGGGHPAERALD